LSIIPQQAFAPTPAANETQTLDSLIVSLEELRSSRVLTYWTTDAARLSGAVIPSLYDQLTSIGKTPRLDLFLRTFGGDTEAPWRIVSLIREFCDEFNVLVPDVAMSSGTLTSLGADSIVMTKLGVLGPIDPSRTHPLLPKREGAEEAEPVSVQDMRHAMQFIREAAEPGRRGWRSSREMPYTPEALAQIFTALFDKIHPLAIGAIEQSYALSKLVGTQCLKTHMSSAGDEAKIKQIVDKLCDEYKSHGYTISRKEARDDIGLNVIDASDDVEKAMMDLFRFYTARPARPMVAPPAGTRFQMFIAWLDSTDAHLRVEGEYVTDQAGQIAPQGDAWAPY
jgi:hypothetical protein